MTPEAFIELCEQHYGKSNPAFVKAMKRIADGGADTDTQSFTEYVQSLIRRSPAGGSGAESGGKNGAPRK